MHVQPYLFFNGRTEEAIEFYRTALGATNVELMRNKDSPEPSPPGMLPPGSENKIMHASFKVGDSTILASDGRCDGKPVFQGFGLPITVKTESEADRLFDGLASGGKVTMLLTKTFFSFLFGFGVGWVLQHASGVAERARDLALRGLHAIAGMPVEAALHGHVDEALREQLHRRCRLRERAILLDQRAQHGERGHDGIAGRVLVEADEMPRVLAAKDPSALEHLLQHVAVTHLRTRKRNAERAERLLEAEVAHLRADHTGR